MCSLLPAAQLSASGAKRPKSKPAARDVGLLVMG
jgi:hypothetical protein